MGLNRRSFLMFVAGASAGIMVTPVPWKLLDDASIWTQNWSWIPSNVHGPNSFVPAISKTCPSSTAVKVRLVGDRPVRMLPFDDHPLGGGLTAITAAEVQMLYSPSRVTQPLERSADGAYRPITWEAAAQRFYDAVKDAGSDVAFLSGDETGTTNEIISAFASAIGSDNMFLMPSEGQTAAVAASVMGISGQIGYNLENSDFILALGANVLETWGPVTRNRRVFYKAQPYSGQEGVAPVVLAYAGPIKNNTATAAKYWLPVLPGTEGILTLGIASELIKRGRTAEANDFAEFRDLCMQYDLDQVAALTGVSAEAIKDVIEALLAAKAPVVIAGSGGAGGTGAAPVIAGFALNALLGNINARGGLTIIPDAPVVVSGAKRRRDIYNNNFQAWLGKQTNAKVLVVHEANPAFALPGVKTVKEQLAKIPFKVSFTAFMDETAAMSDLVLPIGAGLERYDDVANPYGFGAGIYCITQPVAKAPEQARNTGDIFLTAASNLGKNLGFTKTEEVYRRKVTAMRGNIDLLAAGKPAINETLISAHSYSFRPALLKEAFALNPADKTLHLAVDTRLAFGTPTIGIPPFNTKLLRETELLGSKMFVTMSGVTAAALGLKKNMAVTLTTSAGAIAALLHISDVVRPGTVAVNFGFGHTALDDFSKNKGFNVMEILEAAEEPKTGLAVWSKTAVTVTKA